MADTMPETVAAALTTMLILAAAIWVGGFATLIVVARVAGRTLPPHSRVALFRGLGKAYGVIGPVALAVAYGTGASLVYGRPWDGQLTATAVVATALVVTTTIGMIQARRMSHIRRQALDQPDDVRLSERIHQGARRASALRALLGALSLALLALGVLLGT